MNQLVYNQVIKIIRFTYKLYAIFYLLLFFFSLLCVSYVYSLNLVKTNSERAIDSDSPSLKNINALSFSESILLS